MAYDIQEQEQLDALKDWWKTYGNRVMVLTTIGLFAFSGFMGWQWYQRKQTVDAAPIYEALIKAAAENDMAKLKAASGDLVQKYSKSPQAQYGALLAAKTLLEAGDVKTAKAQLQWVVEHGRDEEYRASARLRLAGVLLDEKAYDAGLQLLKDEPPAAYVGLFADRRGDLYVGQNKLDDARKAYDLALGKLGEKDPLKQIVELKRDALGGGANVALNQVEKTTPSTTQSTTDKK